MSSHGSGAWSGPTLTYSNSSSVAKSGTRANVYRGNRMKKPEGSWESESKCSRNVWSVVLHDTDNSNKRSKFSMEQEFHPKLKWKQNKTETTMDKPFKWCLRMPNDLEVVKEGYFSLRCVSWHSLGDIVGAWSLLVKCIWK